MLYYNNIYASRGDEGGEVGREEVCKGSVQLAPSLVHGEDDLRESRARAEGALLPVGLRGLDRL